MKHRLTVLALALAAALAGPLAASAQQIQAVDPDKAIDPTW